MRACKTDVKPYMMMIEFLYFFNFRYRYIQSKNNLNDDSYEPKNCFKNIEVSIIINFLSQFPYNLAFDSSFQIFSRSHPSRQTIWWVWQAQWRDCCLPSWQVLASLLQLQKTARAPNPRLIISKWHAFMWHRTKNLKFPWIYSFVPEKMTGTSFVRGMWYILIVLFWDHAI